MVLKLFQRVLLKAKKVSNLKGEQQIQKTGVDKLPKKSEQEPNINKCIAILIGIISLKMKNLRMS